MSILPVESSSSVLYTYPIRSSSTLEPIPTSSSPPEPAVTTAPGEPSSIPTIDQSADTIRSQFSASTTWTFGASGALPSGLSAAADHIDGTPLSHTFTPSNVHIADSFLHLTVPGGQAGSADISSAEISTTFAVRHASVRTWAILTEEPGVCNGMFFYQSDSQETDIEWISDPRSQSNVYANNGTRALQYTNQAVNGVFEDATSAFGRAPEDATSVRLYMIPNPYLSIPPNLTLLRTTPLTPPGHPRIPPRLPTRPHRLLPRRRAAVHANDQRADGRRAVGLEQLGQRRSRVDG